MLRAALFRIVKTWKQLRCPLCFPGGSDGIESACNARDLGLTPGSGRSPGKGNGRLTPVLLPGKSHGQRSLVGYRPWDYKESHTTEQLHFTLYLVPRKKYF